MSEIKNEDEFEERLGFNEMEQAVMEQGYFNLLEWLLRENIVEYADFESWRNGGRQVLDDCFRLEKGCLDRLIDRVRKMAPELELITEVFEFPSWSGSCKNLTASDDTARHLGLSQRWIRQSESRQLHLFMDNQHQILQNELQQALGNHAWSKAETRLEALIQLKPRNRKLKGYGALIGYGRHIYEDPEIAHADLEMELEDLQKRMEPLARELLAGLSRDYLAFSWRRLANAMQDRSFDPRMPELHVSYALQQIPDWRGLEQLLVKEQDLLQHHTLMERLVEALWMRNKQNLALVYWCLWFDAFPEQAEQAIASHTRQPVHSLWEGFHEADLPPETTWFAGYLLIQMPGLLTQFPRSLDFQQPATLSVVRLLSTDKTDGSELAARRQLQKTCPAMLQCYLEKQTDVSG